MINLNVKEYETLCQLLYELKPHLINQYERSVIQKIINQDKINRSASAEQKTGVQIELDSIIDPNQIDLEDLIFQAEIEQNNNTNQLGLNL
jgi:hypothetical protein